MSWRRGKSRRRRWWPWLLGALAGAAAAYFLLFRPPGGGTIPVPGEPARSVGDPALREEIRKVDREALERVLRERSRAR